MNKNRQTRVMTIVALMLAVVGMTLGFAVFSRVLTISSSVTVTPNEEDFKVVIYGAIDNDEISKIEAKLVPDLTKWSKTSAMAVDEYNIGITTTDAVIDNETDIVNNMSVEFTGPNQMVSYFYVVKNEGKYDAYLNIPQEIKDAYLSGDVIGKCTPGVGTTPILVEDACKNIIGQVVDAYDSQFNWISYKLVTTSDYLLKQGDYVVVQFAIWYYENAPRADGPFSIVFDDLVFDISTAASSTNS